MQQQLEQCAGQCVSRIAALTWLHGPLSATRAVGKCVLCVCDVAGGVCCVKGNVGSAACAWTRWGCVCVRQEKSSTGLEPAISRFVGGCLIHWATRTFNPTCTPNYKPTFTHNKTTKQHTNIHTALQTHLHHHIANAFHIPTQTALKTTTQNQETRSRLCLTFPDACTLSSVFYLFVSLIRCSM